MPDPAPASDRIAALDGVRGFAALLVVFWHYIPSSTRAEPGTTLAYLAKAGGLCWTGVDLFFVLSGFLIGRILLRQRNAPNLFRAFYTRRACRIVPLFFLMIAVYAVLRAFLPPGEARERLIGNPFPLWAYPLFLQNILMTAADHFGTPLLSVSWSLAVEEQFYLVAPLLVSLLPQKLLPWMFGGLFAGAALIRPLLSPMGGYALLWARADCLAAGCLLAWWAESGGPHRLRRHPLLATIVSALFVAACALYIWRGDAMYGATHGWGRYHLTWIATGYALLLAVILAWPAGFVARCFDNPLLRRAGLLSYGIYLVHGPVMHAWFEFVRSSPPLLQHTRELWILLPIGAVAWLVTELLHHFIERPFLRLGHRTSYRR